MKRSNRLVLLVGVFLAVIAFVGVILLSQGGTGTDPNAPATRQNVVVAAEDIPLGTVIENDMVATQEVDIPAVNPGAFIDPSQVVGQIARQEVLTGQQITSAVLEGTGISGQNIDVPAGYRAMSVLVDQVSGVGALIKTGDWVDMVIRMDIKPVIVSEDGTTATSLDAIDGDTSKLLLQGMQVVGALRPTVPTAEGATPAPGGAFDNSQELVILAVTPAQAEVIKWAQNEEQVSVSLVLRSPDDFVDANGNRLTAESPCLTVRPPTPLPTPTAAPGESPAPTASATPIPPFPCEVTDGVVLQTLVEEYGVLLVGDAAPSLGGESPEPTEPAESPAP